MAPLPLSILAAVARRPTLIGLIGSRLDHVSLPPYTFVLRASHRRLVTSSRCQKGSLSVALMRDGRVLGGPKCRHEGNITTALFTAAGRVHRKMTDVCYDGMTDEP